MKNSEENKKKVPPYIPYKTLNSFLEKMKVGIPSRIDRSVMASMSGGAQSQLTVALKHLNLIDANGQPEENLTRLVTSEGADRQEILKDILKKAYAFLFADGVDLTRVTANHLQELFTKEGASGGTTQKCIAFFIAASKDAGFELSPHIKVKSQTIGTRPRKKASTPQKVAPVKESTKSAEQTPTSSMGITQMFLSKFPSFDPAWPDEVKLKWFEGFKELREQFKEE